MFIRYLLNFEMLLLLRKLLLRILHLVIVYVYIFVVFNFLRMYNNNKLGGATMITMTKKDYIVKKQQEFEEKSAQRKAKVTFFCIHSFS